MCFLEIHRGKEASGGKRASQREESFPVGRDLPIVGRELPSGKRASHLEESFLVGRGLLGLGRELPGGKGDS